MSNYEFIKYEPTPGEKHLGIATIKLWGRIILRYKIVPNKDGSGWFPACASYKMPGVSDTYISCFMLDSNSEKEEVENVIRAGVKACMNQRVSSSQQNQQWAPAQQQAPIQQNQYQAPQPQYAQPYPQAQQPSFPEDEQQQIPF